MWVECSRLCRAGIGLLAWATSLAACGGVSSGHVGAGGSSPSAQGGGTSGGGGTTSNEAGRAGLNGGGAAGADGKSTSQTGTVEIYSWWTAGGEAQALARLIDRYKTTYPGDDVLNSTAGSADPTAAFDAMKKRLADGDPPDAWQAILGADLRSYTRFLPPDAPAGATPVNQVQNLDDLYATQKWADKFPPGVLSAVREGGHYFGVPISVGRLNELFYNKAIFDKYKLAPPTTLNDLFAIGEALKGEVDADGDPIIPLVISSGYDVTHAEAWPVRFVFDAVLLSEPKGVQFRQAYYSGNADPADPAYLQGATDFVKLLTQYTNAGNEDLAATGTDAHALKLQWEGAADMLHSGRAAMFLHGNWVKAYLESKGDVADTDFGVVQFPPNAFVYAGDSFVMSKDAPHRNPTLDFLKVAGNPDAQSTLNKLKGALPARVDADTTDFDTVGQEEATDYRNPDVALLACSWDYPPTDYWQCWEDALFGIVQNHDAAAFVQSCKDKYSELKAP